MNNTNVNQHARNTIEPTPVLLLPSLIQRLHAVNSDITTRLNSLEDLIYRLNGITRPKEDGSGCPVSAMAPFTVELSNEIGRASVNFDRLTEMVSILEELV